MKNIQLLLIAVPLFFGGVAKPADLKKAGKEFTSLTVKCDEKSTLALGQTIKIGIIATTASGKEYKTNGFLKPGLLKSVDWSEFSIEVEGGTFRDGEVTVNSNLLDIKNHEVKIRASSVKDPRVKTELVIVLDYKGITTAVFEGTSGRENRVRRDLRDAMR